MIPKGAKPKAKWRDAIALTEKMLKVTEIWPSADRTYFRQLKVCFFFITSFIFDVTILVELINLLQKQDFELLAVHLSTFALYIGFTLKIFIFQFKKGKPLSDMLRSISQPIFDDYPPEMEHYKIDCIKVSNGVARSYAICVAVSIFVYLNKPLYTEYPLPITFPHMDTLNTYTLYGLLALQSFCNYYLVMIGIAFDFIIIGLINIATAQLDILQELIGAFKKKNPACTVEEEYYFFCKCAKRHDAVVRFMNETEEVLTLIFLVQCLISVTSVCNGLFQLAYTGELFSVQFYFNCAFTLDVFFEIGLCCWFATLLTVKSVEVGDACYNYDWVNSSIETKKLLLTIILRGQMPMYVTAGKVIRLSMGAFLSVVKTGYSYFALMQTLYNKKNRST